MQFGSKSGTKLKVASDKSLSVVAPAGTGTVDVRVVTKAGTSATSTLAKYRYVAAPKVTKVSTTTGGVGGGPKVTLTGSNFIDVTKVTFGSTAGTQLQVNSEKSLTIVAPAHKAGKVDVRVATPYGTSAKSSKARFTFIAAPKVSSVSPNVGKLAGGTKVTIKGSNLSKITRVTFAGTAGTKLKVPSTKKLTVSSPAGKAGIADVQVVGTYGESAKAKAARFTYIAAPTITKLSPVSGPTKGGTKVTITGTDFTKVSKVTFGSKPGTKLSVKSKTSLTVVTPKQSSQTVDVRVTGSYGTSATNANTRYTYGTAPAPTPAPTITSVSPASGTTAGGTKLTITGTNLTGTSKVTTGGVAASGLTVVSATQVTVTSPAHAAGVADVVLTAPGGTVTKSGAFTYVTPTPAAPTISSVAPATGTTAGGTNLTITGTNLNGTSKVIVGGAEATGLTVVSATQVTVVAPPHAAGAVDIGVTTPGGAVTKAGAFTYVAPAPAAPTITSVTPSSGTTAGGTKLTVTGTNLTGTSKVTIGGADAIGLIIVSATQLTVTSPAHAAGVTDVTVFTPGGQATLAKGFTFEERPCKPGVKHISGSLTEDTTWGEDSCVLVYVIDNTVNVPASHTLSIKPGAVIKFGGSISTYPSAINVAGRLSIEGTTDKPVIMTSTSDDSAAGDTNNNGPSTPATIYGAAVEFTQGAEVSITHAEFRNFYYSIYHTWARGSNQSRTSEGEVRITHSRFSGSINTIDINGETANGYHGAVILKDNRIESGHVRMKYIYDYEVARNTFTDKVQETPLDIDRGNILGLPLVGPNANSFSGSPAQRTIRLNGYIPAGSNSTLASPPGGALVTAGLSIESGAKATITAGSIIKLLDGWGSRPLVISGSLIVEGDAQNPVILTSPADDTAGGDTNSDGDASQPKVASWSGVQIQDGGALTGSGVDIRYAATGVTGSKISSMKLNDSTIRYAWTCLSITGLDSASYFHGKLRDCTVGVSSDGITPFDATDIDWGGGLGPRMNGNPRTEGPSIRVSPWIGQPALPPVPTPSAPRSVKEDGKCTKYLFIGVRGSGEPAGLGSPVNKILQAFRQKHSDTKVIPLDYSANAVPIVQDTRAPWTWLNQVGEYQPSAWSGSVELIRQIKLAISECSDSGQKIVVAGYSQGAWAVHAAMNYLSATRSSAISNIAAVGLIADPLRESSSGLQNMGTGKGGRGVASSGLGNIAVSYGTMIQEMALADLPDIPNASMSDFKYPAALTSRTIDLCNTMDMVCDFENLMDENSQYWLGIGLVGAFLAGSEVHSNYGEPQTYQLGIALAEKS